MALLIVLLVGEESGGRVARWGNRQKIKAPIIFLTMAPKVIASSAVTDPGPDNSRSARLSEGRPHPMQCYVGQLLLIPYTFAPNGWLFSQGQLVAISEFNVLYNLIGTTYGGDGVNTFALPDLRGRTPIGMGQLTGGGNYVLGTTGGAETVT